MKIAYPVSEILKCVETINQPEGKIYNNSDAGLILILLCHIIVYVYEINIVFMIEFIFIILLLIWPKILDL